MYDKQLIPEKYPQGDLFICDVADAILKDILPQMEHPFYSLSKKPETKIRHYEHNGNTLIITPSVKGMATIYDKDILIYAISQIMAKLNAGEEVSPRIRINSHELLRFTKRKTDGRAYIALTDALERLRGTTIRTDIKTGGETQTDIFGLIDTAGFKRKNGMDGRLEWCEIKLSDWVFNAIRANEVLTLNPDYFRLRKPTERRLYEIARKHCGRKDEWSIGLALLHKKSGSQSSLKEFRRKIKPLLEHDHLPDYTIEMNEETGKVTFKNREKWWKDAKQIGGALPPFSPLAFEEAKKVAPSYDVYYLEREFREWWSNSGKSVPDHLTKAFVGFCKARHKRKPYP